MGLAWQWPTHLSSSHRHRTTHLLVLSGWVVLLLFTAVPRGFTLKRLLIVMLSYLALVTAYVLVHLPRRTALLIGLSGLLISLIILPTEPATLSREVMF